MSTHRASTIRRASTARRCSAPSFPQKTIWHRTGSVVLTPEAAEQFLAKYPLKEVLDAESIESLTSRLKPALQEGTDENVTVELTVGERS